MCIYIYTWSSIIIKEMNFNFFLKFIIDQIMPKMNRENIKIFIYMIYILLSGVILIMPNNSLINA